MMLFYKAWRESQARFLWAAVALALWCLTVLFPALTSPPAQVPRMLQGQSYSQYINLWFYDGIGKLLFILLVIFLGLGGLLRERAHHTAIFSLALPVRRVQLVGAQIAVGLAELAVLAFLPILLIGPLSALVHQFYAIGDAFRFGLLRLICGTLIFAMSFLLSVLLRGEYTAVVACVIALMLDGRLSNWGAIHPYHTNLLRTIAARWDWFAIGPDLSGPLPWTLLSILILIAVALFAAASGIAERQSA
jgi:ABC-type transport system involved in multi-copper enzyme maturation permease subunit